MTATLPAAVDPLSGAVPAEQRAAMAKTFDSIGGDAERFGLRPIDLSVHLSLGACSATVQFAGGDTAAVDALAAAYGAPDADPAITDLYSRAADVTMDGQQVHVTVYCAPPEPTPQAALPAVPQAPAVDAPVPPAVDGGLPQPLQVAAQRVDTPAATA